MSGSFADHLHCRRATLAIALAVLAVLFAVEAKTAWYGPFGAGGDVQSAKAFPADTPKILLHGTSLPNPLSSHNLLFPVVALIAVSVCAARAQWQSLDLRHTSVIDAAFFSPLFLFRPPPVL